MFSDITQTPELWGSGSAQIVAVLMTSEEFEESDCLSPRCEGFLFQTALGETGRNAGHPKSAWTRDRSEQW